VADAACTAAGALLGARRLAWGLAPVEPPPPGDGRPGDADSGTEAARGRAPFRCLLVCAPLVVGLGLALTNEPGALLSGHLGLFGWLRAAADVGLAWVLVGVWRGRVWRGPSRPSRRAGARGRSGGPFARGW
jgi:hypothetical protein